MSKIYLRSLLSVLFVLCSGAYAEEIPESLLPHFVNDTTLSVSQDSLGASSSESVDPFTGKLLISATDMVVPGDGGLDISIIRSYQSQNVMPIPVPVKRVQDYSPLGLGWTMHFGEIRIAKEDKMCSTIWDAWVDDNPVYVRADGGTELLAIAPDSVRTEYGLTYISDSYSKVICQPDGSFYMVDTSGTRYDFGISYANEDSSAKYRWAVTKITDRHGNFIDISYSLTGTYLNQTLVVDQVSASDGRVIDFSYSGTPKRLDTISYGENTLSYYYDDVNYALGSDADGSAVERPDVVLRRFVAPNGQDWKYDYYPLSYEVSQGGGSISATHNPYGGTVGFEYDLISFVANPEIIDYPNSLVVSKKIQEGVGTWNYSYNPGLNEDVTTVAGPLGVRTYHHFGISSVADGELWKVGKLKRETFASNSGESTETQYTWAAHALSNEDYRRRSPSVVDDNYQTAYLTSKVTTLDGDVFSEDYSIFTSSDFNPTPMMHQKTVQTSHSGSRELGLRYYWNSSNWIFHKSQDLIDGNVLYSTDYDTSGNLIEIIEHGVKTIYTYYPNGNLKTEKKGHHPETNYSQYKHGVPEKISKPELGAINQTIDEFGRISESSDGLGNKTDYEYDALGRPLSVTPPIGKATNYSWGNNQVTISALGSADSKLVEFDGFGRIVKETYHGMGMLDLVLRTSYDSSGRITSQSMAMDGNTYSYGYDYDGIGRLIYKSTPSGGVIVSHGPGWRTVTDQNSHSTTYDFDEYSPGEKYTRKIKKSGQAPINIDVDYLGRVLDVEQNGIVKTYSYGNWYKPMSYSDPESGYVLYGYDSAGDIDFVAYYDAKGGSLLRYEDYVNDDLGRPEEIIYGKKVTKSYMPEWDAYDEISLRKEFEYDLAGRQEKISSIYQTDTYASNGSGGYSIVSTKTSPVSWVFGYDNASNLTSEKLTVDGHEFAVTYDYDDFNNRDVVTYPSGRQIELNPNYFGVETSALPYVPSVLSFPTGQVKTMSYANGDQVSAEVGIDGFLSSMAVSGPGGSVLDFTYSHDDVGNVTNITSSDTSRNRQIGYNAYDQLTSVVSPSWQEGYTYDDIGNIKTKTVDTLVTNYNYNAKNQLASLSGGVSKTYSYNGVGAVNAVDNRLSLVRGPQNLVASIVDNKGTHDAYDDERTDMRYDGRDQRVSIKKDGAGRIYTLYGASGDLLFQLDPEQDSYIEYINVAGRLVAEVKAQFECSDDFDGDGIPHCQEKDWGLDPYLAADAELDNDSDGLTNIEEFQFGTDARSSDSDSDGMPDEWEITYGLDPTNNDASGDLDGDGHSNIDEYSDGQDPTVADPPRMVSGVVASSGDGLNALTWSGSALSGSYRVYYSQQPFFDKAGAQAVDVTGRHWLHDTLQNGASYYYRIVAVNEFGESDLSEMVSAYPGNSQWTWFKADGREYQMLSIDGAKNAYVVSGDLVFSYLNFYKAFSSNAPISTEVLDFSSTEPGRLGYLEVGAGGHVVVTWTPNTNNYSHVALYNPSTGAWQTHDLIKWIEDVSISPLGYAAVAYKRSYSDYPHVAVFSPEGSLISDRRLATIDVRDIEMEINDVGLLSVVFADDLNVYYSELSTFSGSWSNNISIVEGDYYYSTLDVASNNNGDVVVYSGDFGIKVRKSDNWLPLEAISSSSLDVAILDNGSLFVGSENSRGGVEVKRGVVADGSISWDSDLRLTRDGRLAGLVAARQTNSAHVIWQENGDYELRHHEWGGGAWTEKPFDNPPDFLPDSYHDVDMSVDIAGNITLKEIYPHYSGSYPKITGAFMPQKGYGPTFNPAVKKEVVSEGLNASSGAVVTAGWGYSGIIQIDLDGYASWEWSQLSGPNATIDQASGTGKAPNATFTLPEVQQDTVFLFELTQHDEQGMAATARYEVTLQDLGAPPVVDAGAGGSISEADVLNLTGSASDPDGEINQIMWTQTEGPQVSWLTSQDVLSPSVSLPNVHEETEIRFELAVTDSSGRVVKDEVVYVVQNSDGSEPLDPEPPVLTVETTSFKSKGDTYYSVTISSDKPATIYVGLFLGGYLDWSGGSVLESAPDEVMGDIYTGTFEVIFTGGNNDPARFRYFAKDEAGNETDVIYHTLN